MKKIFVVITILCLLLGTSGCNSTSSNSSSQNEVIKTEGKYPTKWDDTEFYKTEEDINKDLEQLRTWGDEFLKFKGKLNTVDGLYGFVVLDSDKQYCAIYDRLASYANFGSSVFPAEQKYLNCLNKLNEVMNEVYEKRGFVDEEMASMSFIERAILFADEKLIDYAPSYSRYLYDEVAVTDEETLDLYKNATLSQGRIQHIFDTFSNIEIPSIYYKLKNGETLEVNNKNYRSLLMMDKYSLEEKVAFNDEWWKNVLQYKNTLTSLLETQLLEQYSNALVNGYPSTKYQALASLYADEDIIQKIIDYGHKSAGKLESFYKLFADENGNYYTFSDLDKLSTYRPDYISYDDGVDTVISALSVMGDEYVGILKEEFNSGHIDVYPAENKKPGAFETGNYVDLYPYIMFNYNGTYTDVSTLSHEIGHACYDILCNRNQTVYNWGAAIFTHEVASLTNELTYYQYMIANSKTDEEKLYHMQNLLYCWVLNLYDSCYWQEFEQYCHELVESGETLDTDELTQKWIDLGKEYYGQGLIQGEYGQYRWLTIPNLYNNYYEYQYATAICYATVLSQNLINNVPGARENYINFLKTGASISSVEALQIAGIDIYDDNVYQQAFSFFEEMVENFENLAKK